MDDPRQQFIQQVSPMPQDDISLMSPILERYMTSETNVNPSYWFTGQREKDERLIKDVAGHYIGKEILKKYEKHPEYIAQELLNRLVIDKKM